MSTIHDRCLTPRQEQILAYLCTRRFPPTIGEIAAEFGIKSPNGVICHLQALARKGYIERDPLLARGIHVLTE